MVIFLQVMRASFQFSKYILFLPGQTGLTKLKIIYDNLKSPISLSINFLYITNDNTGKRYV